MFTTCRFLFLNPLADPRFEAYAGPGRLKTLIRDGLAGLIVALVAIPLGVGFSIASGLAPEQGIMAGAVAGVLGGLFGGSKYQVSGPTAAFIPLLSGIVASHGGAFLILASLLAGGIVLLMGLLRLGNHFSRVPASVTIGFTLGIAASIAVGQLPDILGSTHAPSPHMLEKLGHVGELLGRPNAAAFLLAALTFVTIKLCYRVSVFVPGPLIAIVAAIGLDQAGLLPGAVPLVADKFGPMGSDMFKLTLPGLGANSPWALAPAVLSIVFIAALESLLSARMANRLAHDPTPYDPNRELFGQGVVNMVVPLLNGFPCTGAFARTATSIKAGASSPLASLFKGAFVIGLMLFFARYIALIPMACIGGLLLYVALNMVKMEEVRYIFRRRYPWVHAGLMLYTALVTFFADLFIAVSTATGLYYVMRLLRPHLAPYLSDPPVNPGDRG